MTTLSKETCAICGRKSTQLFMTWWQYDNGEQFRTGVCNKCKQYHFNHTKKGK